MRNLLFTAVMVGIEILVVVHWFLLPDNPYLFAMAIAAGVVMSGMALVDFFLLFRVIGMDPAVPQQQRELRDLATAEPVWVAVTVFQAAFIAAAVVAQVYWIAVVLVIGQGAELVAFFTARARQHGSPREPHPRSAARGSG